MDKCNLTHKRNSSGHGIQIQLGAHIKGVGTVNKNSHVIHKIQMIVSSVL